MDWWLAPLFLGVLAGAFWLGTKRGQLQTNEEASEKLEAVKRHAKEIDRVLSTLSDDDLINRVRGARGIRPDS